MLAHLAEADLGRAVGYGPNHSADQATSEAYVALERQNNIDNNIDNGSAESSCNDPHRRIEPVLGGLRFK